MCCVSLTRADAQGCSHEMSEKLPPLFPPKKSSRLTGPAMACPLTSYTLIACTP